MNTVERYEYKTVPCGCDGGCDLCDYRGTRREIAHERTDLKMARRYMEQALIDWDRASGDGDSAYWRSRGDIMAQRASHYMALAQATALTRIAEVLEQHLDDASTDRGCQALVDLYRGALPA